MALLGLLTQGWPAAVINTALLLILVLGFRAWARRRYGVGDERPASQGEG